MQQSDAMSERVFFTGLCAGAVVGAGFALLFTPRTGSQLREQLADSAARAAAAVSGTVDALAHRGDIATQANGTVSREAEAGRTHVGKGLATLGEMAALHGEDWRAAIRS
ncbi:MAG: YtxH domain-containing protein [Acidobacteriota bacterium]